MNCLSHFVDTETNPIRLDSREGNSFWLRSEHCTLSIQKSGEFIPINGIVGPIAYTSQRDLRKNVFCMYALDFDRPIVDERNFVFRDTFAAISNPNEFLSRLSRAAAENGLTLKHGRVDYVDESSYLGRMGTFRKTTSYDYQSEFRIVVSPGRDSPIVLNVGDLRDFIITGPLSEINQLIRKDQQGSTKYLQRFKKDTRNSE